MSFALGMTPMGEAGRQLTAKAHIATVADFPTDDLVFDSGYLRGTGGADRNAASIPLGGALTDQATGPISEDVQIEARAALVDATGFTAWQVVGTASTGATTWTGTMDLPRNASRYRIEVRVQGSDQIDQMGTVCAVGHVLTILGQSEHQRIGDANQQAALTPPTVAAEGRVRVAWRPNDEAEAVQWTVVSNTTPHSPAVAAMANALSEMRPNDHFTVLFQTKGATNLKQLANDAETLRSWAEDLDIVNKATGNQITGFGAVLLDWTAGPGSWGEDYDQAFGRFFTKKLPGGADMSAGDTYTGATSNDTITFDHYWADLDPSVPVLPYGPHRFETVATGDDATSSVTYINAERDEAGALIGPMAQKRMTRNAMRRLKDYPGGNFWPKGASPLLYRNGDAGSTVPWSDFAHPGKIDNNQGLPLWAQQNAYIAGRMMGWAAWTPPEIQPQHVTWEPSGAYVEIDIGQTLSTVALQEGDPSADVAGFEVSGRDAAAEIVAGKIRVYHPDGTFTANDTLRFGMGGASGVLTMVGDVAAEIWKRWPMVPMIFTAEYDASGNTCPGIALEPVSDYETVFANPLGLPAGSSTIVDAASTWQDESYPDSINTPWSSVTNKVTMQLTFTPVSGWVPSSYQNLISYGSLDPVSLSLHSTNGRVRVRARDPNGVGSIQINAHTVTYGEETTLTFAVDFSDPADGKMWLRDGAGALLWSQNGIASSGVFDRSVFTLFGGQYTGGFTRAVFWTDCAPDGSALPLQAAYRVIAGTPQMVNAHEWKLGPDAV